MKQSPFVTSKQSGAVKAITIVASGVSSAVIKYADTIYYQVTGHGDYVQEKN